MDKIEEKISSLHSEHSERLHRVETLLINLMKRFDDTDPDAVSGSYSHTDTKEKRRRAQTLEAALSIKAKSLTSNFS